MLAIIAAFSAPLLSALVNVIDKWIVTRRVKNVISFAVLMGCFHLVIGSVIAFLVDWTGVTLAAAAFPFVCGILLGIQVYFYYMVLREHDVSHAVGFVYVYPVIVAVLSFIILHERLSGAGYAGALLAIGGVLLLSRAFEGRKMVTIWLIAIILLIGVNDFLIKLATLNVSVLQGVSLNGIGVGVALLPALFHGKTRRDFKKEFTNIPFVLLIECFGFASLACLYAAMDGLPAAVVASIASIQPLAVLIFERTGSIFVGKIDKEYLLLPRLVPITIIILGVALLYLAELM